MRGRPSWAGGPPAVRWTQAGERHWRRGPFHCEAQRGWERDGALSLGDPGDARLSPQGPCALEPSRRLVNTARPKGGPGPWCSGHVGAQWTLGLGATPRPHHLLPEEGEHPEHTSGSSGAGRARWGMWGLQAPALQVQSESRSGPALMPKAQGFPGSPAGLPAKAPPEGTDPLPVRGLGHPGQWLPIPAERWA